MLIKRGGDIRSSEITPRQTYLRRREFLASAGAPIAAMALGTRLGAQTRTLTAAKRMVTTADAAGGALVIARDRPGFTGIVRPVNATA